MCVYRCEYVREHVSAVMHMYICVKMWMSGILLSLSSPSLKLGLVRLVRETQGSAIHHIPSVGLISS